MIEREVLAWAVLGIVALAFWTALVTEYEPPHRPAWYRWLSGIEAVVVIALAVSVIHNG